jgi:uncharacterized membrane protein YjjP (DUF1212 family)
MDTNKIAHVAVDAGRIILENGGETYRVEDTILRILAAYNLEAADSFVTPTGIMVSVTDRYAHTVTIVKRIRKRTVDLEKISRVNDLSRNIKTKGMTSDNLSEELIKIDNLQRYDTKTTIIFSALAAAFFTLLFGGNLNDFFSSFLIGGIIKYVGISLSSLSINDFFINIFGGILAAFLAIISGLLSLSDNLDKVIIGSIMLLVPGLSITNAIRDTIAGDLVSGITRAIEAVLVAVAIAVGTGITLKIWLSLSGGFQL